eukprot:jgi/Astpho2/3289/gw1.00054.147.1_t
MSPSPTSGTRGCSTSTCRRGKCTGQRNRDGSKSS